MGRNNLKHDLFCDQIDTNWYKMKDWYWNQIDGLEGKDRIISKNPILVIAQEYNGKIHTKVIQKPNIKLSTFTNVVCF